MTDTGEGMFTFFLLLFSYKKGDMAVAGGFGSKWPRHGPCWRCRKGGVEIKTVMMSVSRKHYSKPSPLKLMQHLHVFH